MGLPEHAKENSSGTLLEASGQSEIPPASVNYVCNDCGKNYSCSTSLNFHRRECRSYHMSSNQNSSKNYPKTNNPQPVNNPTLSSHQNTVFNETARSNRHPRSLRNFLTSGTIYSCWDCGRAYTWASSLSRHRNVECGAIHKKKFVCNICNYRTGYRGNFMRHLKYKHGSNTAVEKKTWTMEGGE